MPEFETLKSQRIEFNMGEFLELSTNVVRDGARETKYLRIARGYHDSKGEPRYKKGGLTLPANREALDQLADAIKALDLSEFQKGGGEPEG